MKTLFFIIAATLQSAFAFSQGATELFIEVPEQGKVTVYVDDEMISSSKNLFRFYDLDNLNPTVTVLQNNRQIAKTKISVKPNHRNFLNYSKRAGLQQQRSLPIFQNNVYSLDDWNGVITTTPSRTERPDTGRPTRGSVLGTVIMNDQSFKELQTLLSREAFEDGKTKLLSVVLSNNMITTAQLITLLGQFSFDERKLVAAKAAYPGIADKQNFFKVTEVFSFSSSKENLLDFIKNTPLRS